VIFEFDVQLVICKYDGMFMKSVYRQMSMRIVISM
jgi:hypothetical protein